MPDAPSPNPCTILICDDEAPIRCVVGNKLRAAGFEVLEAYDGEEGLALAIERTPAIIVSDFQMPNKNGLEMCVELRATPATARIPAILLTARGHACDQTTLDRTNIRRLMAKPFSAKDLLRAVQDVLANEHGVTSQAA